MCLNCRWEDARANLTVYATVPLGFIRYLTKRYVEKDSPTLNQFNELKYGRPEFYFFVTEHKLVKEKDMEPLQDKIDKLCQSFAAVSGK